MERISCMRGRAIFLRFLNFSEFVLNLLNKKVLTKKLRANMDVPLVLNNIRIRYGLQGDKRKSSTLSHKADVLGLSMLYYI